MVYPPAMPAASMTVTACGSPLGHDQVELKQEGLDPLRASTMITAMGRSWERLSSRAVWIWLVAPKPSMPRSTVAPASPAWCARRTISA